MNQRLLIVFFTVAVFAAGFGARLWTESVQPVPPPPVVLGVGDSKAGPTPARRGPPRADFVTMVKQVSAGSEVFRKGVAGLDSDFDAAFTALLRPKQLEVWAENQRRFNGRGGPGGRGPEGRGGDNRPADTKGGDAHVADKSSEPRPLSEGEIEGLRRQPLNDVARMLSVNNRLDNYVTNYSLDEKQKAMTKTLLLVRRDKFIALTEGLSPMSIQLSALARELDRLALTVEGPGAADSKPAPKSEPAK
ncbi:MAG: hypothetical protein RL324_1385 [Verrucomicrobiota bacterium]|jgi:hypothetical protein